LTVPLFRRKKGRDQDDLSDLEAGRAATEELAAEGAGEEPGPTRGPWDSTAAPEDGQTRLDLGALLVPGFPGMELRLEVDRATNKVIAVTAVSGEAMLQMQAFAAPRSGNLWDTVRGEILAGLQEAGGHASEAEGPFGTELVAQVPDEGSQGLQPARFVGADGRRWFLRGVFSGTAAVPGEAATQLEKVFAGTVVVRGDQAMAPRDLLPLQMPDQTPVVGERASDWTSLDPLRRGPEITEIH
jgi:hypothetical protein